MLAKYSGYTLCEPDITQFFCFNLTVAVTQKKTFLLGLKNSLQLSSIVGHSEMLELVTQHISCFQCACSKKSCFQLVMTVLGSSLYWLELRHLKDLWGK